MPAATPSASATASATAVSSSTKKYKLRSIDHTADSKLLPCAFFQSAQGCRSGDACKFSHDIAADYATVESSTTTKIPKVKHEETEYIRMDDTIVSSESSDGDEGQDLKVRKVKGQKAATAKMQDNDSPFASAEELKRNKVLANESKKRSMQENNKNPFANPSESKKLKKNNVVAAAPKTDNSSNVVEQVKTTKRSKSLPNNSTPGASLDFRSMNLPVASFVMPGTVSSSIPATDTTQTPSSSSSKTSTLPTPKAETTPPPPLKVALPLPTSTPSGRKWVDLVKKTREHSRYNNLYDLSKYREQDKNAGYSIESLWVKTTPFDKAKESHPQIIAIDCEMCETTDPVSQQKDHRALCRVSIVDVETDEVLLDTLVKPAWPVTNYRSWVNGITSEHLDRVQFTLRHAQAYLMALCTNETVIIGHAVNNDLAALRIDHATVVDSACLYTAADSETAMVSLRDIVAHILKIDMPEKHDSVNDARMAFKAVDHYRAKKGKVEGVPRSTMANAKSNSFNGLRASDYESQLFVHRIPKNACDEAQLLQMFLSYTNVQPVKVDEIEYGNNNNTSSSDQANTSGKTHVHFSSGRHGNLAFDSLEGKAVADASGRLQKKIFLKNGNYIRIRKMAFETSNAPPSAPASTTGTASDGNKN